jgi:hypothetical protein
MASYGVLEEHTTLDPDFSILAFAFCWACGLSWNEAWANVKSSLLDIPMSTSHLNIISLMVEKLRQHMLHKMQSVLTQDHGASIILKMCIPKNHRKCNVIKITVA